MPISIKRLRIEDSEILYSLHNTFYPDMTTTVERCKNIIEDIDSIYIAAFYDNKPVGWVIGYVLHRFRGDKMFLYEIDVEENHQRMGIASKLIEALKTYALEKNCFDMFVLTGKNNSAARALYEKTGGEMDSDDGVQYSWKFIN